MVWVRLQFSLGVYWSCNFLKNGGRKLTISILHCKNEQKFFQKVVKEESLSSTKDISVINIASKFQVIRIISIWEVVFAELKNVLLRKMYLKISELVVIIINAEFLNLPNFIYPRSYWNKIPLTVYDTQPLISIAWCAVQRQGAYLTHKVGCILVIFSNFIIKCWAYFLTINIKKCKKKIFWPVIMVFPRKYCPRSKKGLLLT